MPMPYTPDHLQAALDGLLRKGILQQPTTLADALASPYASRLLRMHAGALARGETPFSATPVTYRRPVVIRPEPPEEGELSAAHQLETNTTRSRLKSFITRPAGIDHKRAAAGDRDDA